MQTNLSLVKTRNRKRRPRCRLNVNLDEVDCNEGFVRTKRRCDLKKVSQVFLISSFRITANCFLIRNSGERGYKRAVDNERSLSYEVVSINFSLSVRYIFYLYVRDNITLLLLIYE